MKRTRPFGQGKVKEHTESFKQTEKAIVYTYDNRKLYYYAKRFDCYYLPDEYEIGVVMNDKLELKER